MFGTYSSPLVHLLIGYALFVAIIHVYQWAVKKWPVETTLAVVGLSLFAIIAAREVFDSHGKVKASFDLLFWAAGIAGGAYHAHRRRWLLPSLK